MSLSFVKNELKSLSPWFRTAACTVFILYVALWFFTMHLHFLQQSQGIVPVLPVISEDSAEYADLAESMIQGNGFAIGGQIETLRTPGYPAVVAALKAVSGSYFSVTLLQIFLTFLAALVIRRIGLRFGSERIGEVAATLFLLNPVTLALALLIYSDSLFLLLFISGFYLAVSLRPQHFIRQILLISLLFGYAIYVRPIGLLALPMFILPIFASHLPSKLKLQAAGMLIACVLVLLSPWMMRNYVHTGVFSFTSIPSSSISWAVARFLSAADHMPLEDAYRILEQRIGTPQTTWRDIRLSDKIRNVCSDIILDRPLAYAAWHLTSSLSFLFPSTIAFALDTYDASLDRAPPFSQGAIRALAAGDFGGFSQSMMHAWWKLAERLLWLGATILALFELLRRRREPLAWAAALVIGYLMALAGPAAGPRYSFQSWPFLFILLSSGCAYLLEKYRHFRASK